MECERFKDLLLKVSASLLTICVNEVSLPIYVVQCARAEQQAASQTRSISRIEAWKKKRRFFEPSTQSRISSNGQFTPSYLERARGTRKLLQNSTELLPKKQLHHHICSATTQASVHADPELFSSPNLHNRACDCVNFLRNGRIGTTITSFILYCCSLSSLSSLLFIVWNFHCLTKKNFFLSIYRFSSSLVVVGPRLVPAWGKNRQSFMYIYWLRLYTARKKWR